MTLFVDRKKAFETKFAHDANMDFKIEALRNKLLGQWVADTLGMAGAPARELITSYSVSCVLPREAFCIVAKANDDLDGAASTDQIEAKLNEFTTTARLQIQSA